MQYNFTSFEEQAIAAWVCRQHLWEIRTLNTSHLAIYLIGAARGGEVIEVAIKVDKKLALKAAEASRVLSWADLTGMFLLRCPFVEEPIIVVFPIAATEEVNPAMLPPEGNA